MRRFQHYNEVWSYTWLVRDPVSLDKLVQLVGVGASLLRLFCQFFHPGQGVQCAAEVGLPFLGRLGVLTISRIVLVCITNDTAT